MFVDVNHLLRSCCDDSSHQDALERLAAHYFQCGLFFEAFACADRRCRIAPVPEEPVFLLLAEALSRLQQHDAAHRIFKDVFESDPYDPLVIRHMIRSVEGDLWSRAARMAIASPRAGRHTIRQACELLWRDGVSSVANLRIDDSGLQGWVAWTTSPSARLRISWDEPAGIVRDLTLPGDALHPLAGRGAWAEHVMVADVGRGVDVQVQTDDKAAESILILRDLRFEAERRVARGPSVESRPRACTVIVPVYDDVAITMRCLERLARQTIATTAIRVIVVNDKPGDADIDRLTRHFAERDGFALMQNDRNLGFIGSVNRALTLVDEDDVVLLNSDVLLPPDALERLKEAAYAEAHIGTVTPMSNNGELTSYPLPFHVNPMGEDTEIDRLDRVAQRVNHGRRVTLPNGIGFCLFIRHDCLRAVGDLRPCFLDGYFEDVDFCLRAQEQGFANVCACNVYVGHQGSSSFKDRKRALVARNLRVLKTRFPNFEQESHAYAGVDPLQMARAAMKPAELPRPGTIIIGLSRHLSSMERRAKRLQATGVEVGLLILTQGSKIVKVGYQMSDGPRFAFATSLEDPFSKGTDFGGLLSWSHIELADSSLLDIAWVARLQDQGAMMTRLFDESPIRLKLPSFNRSCDAAEGHKPCPSCLETLNTTLREAPRKGEVGTASARPLIVTNSLARAFARRQRIPIQSDDDLSAMTATASPAIPATTWVLGILYPHPAVDTERLMVSICRSLALRCPDRRIIVMGNALDDGRLLGAGTTIVTGPIAQKDYAQTMQCYGVGGLLSCDRWSGFGLLEDLSSARACPKAYFDWSLGAMMTAPNDLALNPISCDQQAIRRIGDWCAGLVMRPDAYDT